MIKVERPLASPTAIEIHRKREEENLANHRERVEWLSAPNPKWSCGEPICAHMRHALLVQSKAALNSPESKP